MDKGSLRILIVDDDPVMLRGTTCALVGAGYEVITEASGQAALARIHELHADLVLVDRHLPDPNGVEVCRRIKQDPALADVFVIFLSAVYTDSDEQSEGLESGADGYIVRPIATRELVARVDAFVRMLHLNR